MSTRREVCVRVEQPPPIDTPADIAKVALEHLAFVFNLFAACNSSTISPDTFPEELVLQMSGGKINIKRTYTPSEIQGWSWNLLLSSLAITAQALDRAFIDAFGVRPLDRRPPPVLDELTDVEAAWTMIYMIRCAFAHNPFNPRWECRGAYVGRFQVRALQLTLDTTDLHGKRLKQEDFGGFPGYLEVLRFCVRQLEPK